jgi:hypothetical protein
MKTFRWFGTAFVLLCALTTATMAGEIQGAGFNAPPPPPPVEERASPPATDEMPGADMLILELLRIIAIF